MAESSPRTNRRPLVRSGLPMSSRAKTVWSSTPAGSRRPDPAGPPLPGPRAAPVRAQRDGPHLVRGHDDRRVVLPVRELPDPAELLLELRVAGLLPRLHRLEGRRLLVE